MRDGKILMIDQTTGRVAPGRVWSKGLHQLLEVKEGCAPTGEMETIAQITYQRFFPRYLRLCGMSGTLTEAADELRSVYGLSISRVPLRKPSRRATLPLRVCAWREQKWDAVIERVRSLASEGRPVLIGTDSVADTDQLSYRLTAHGFKHAVLNASNDQRGGGDRCSRRSARITSPSLPIWLVAGPTFRSDPEWPSAEAFTSSAASTTRRGVSIGNCRDAARDKAILAA